jgi:DNA-binding CsgD family transcriptional regulator
MSDLQALILSLYRLTTERELGEFQDAVFRRLQGFLPFDSARWGSAQLGRGPVVFHDAHFFDEDPATVALWSPLSAQDTAASRAIAQWGVPSVYHTRTEFSAPGQAGMRAFALHFRHENGMILVLPGERGVVHTVSLYRREEAHQVSERERRCFALIGPHMMEALTITRRLAVGQLARPEAGMAVHAAIVNPAGFVHLMEPGFAALLGEEWQTTDPVFLPEVLRRALLEQGRPLYVGRRMVARRASGSDPVFLRARRRLPVDDLTPRELAVGARIVAGESHKEIARVLDLSPATVRNHIASIHERLGVHANAELAAHLRARAI